MLVRGRDRPPFLFLFERSNMDLRLTSALEMLAFGLDGSVKAAADIGCDHGKLSLALLETGTVQQVISSDISPASLGKARALAARRGLSERLICRISDGFSAYSESEVQCAVICGMGGELIASILEKGSKIAHGLECIVMQPMRGEAELREYLYTHSYRITDERVVLAGGRYYQLIAASSGAPLPLPDGWPAGYYQFGAEAYRKGDKYLAPMLKRYLGILSRKLASCKGEPSALMREKECAEMILGLVEERNR